MNPFLTVVALDKAVLGVVGEGLVADSTEVPILLQLMTRLAHSMTHPSVVLIPEALIPQLDVGESLLAADAGDAVIAEPGLLRDVREGRVQAVHVHGLVTHVADYYLVLLIVESTALALLAFGALPRLSLHEVHIEWRLITITVKHSAALAALNDG